MEKFERMKEKLKVLPSSYFSLRTDLWFRSNELSNETTFDRTDSIPQQHIGTEEIN